MKGIISNILCLSIGIIMFSHGVHPATVRFQISARHLIPREDDPNDRPDPFAKVFYGGRELVRTSTINNNQYPQWSNTIQVDYNENSAGQIRVELTEEDTGKDDVMGNAYANPRDIHLGVERDIIQGNGMYAGRLLFKVV